MEWLITVPAVLLGAIVVLLGSTVAFDVVHVTLHRLAASRVPWLRALGELHETHHRFLDRDLVVHGELEAANLRRHVIPEFLTHATFSVALLLVLPAVVVLPAFAMQSLVFVYILSVRGRDVNHRGVEALRAHRPMFFCLPEYHAWHHVHPEAHFSSWIKLLDQVLATGSSLAGRRIVVAGVATPFGAALRDALEARGTPAEACFAGAPSDAFGARLRDVDVLILADGADGDAPKWLEAYRDACRGRRLPPEVWAAGGEGDARRRFADPRIIYRQLALVDAAPPARAARTVIDLARRGFHFLPGVLRPAALGVFLRLRWA